MTLRECIKLARRTCVSARVISDGCCNYVVEVGQRALPISLEVRVVADEAFITPMHHKNGFSALSFSY